MQSWLDNFKALNGLTNNSEPARVTSHQKQKTAQRLGRAIKTTYTELKIANRRSRLGQSPTPVIQIVPADRLLSRSRRGPRSTR